MAARKNEKYDKSKKISCLKNCLYYFIQIVFIIAENNRYRLIVVHQNHLWTDQTYKTARGARIAFQRKYGKKAWKKDIKPDWTKFYTPIFGWCEEKLQLNEHEQ